MLEVAVIGAGAAGLAASRHLIGQGLRPFIFEAATTLGGAWSSSSSQSSSSSSPLSPINSHQDHPTPSNAPSTSPNIKSTIATTTKAAPKTTKSSKIYSSNHKMWTGLTTNLSKHTCRFSDFPWSESTPTFPSAIDMHNYLDAYSQQFIDPTCFHYQCQVTNIEPLNHQQQQADPNNNDTNEYDNPNCEKIINGYCVEWTDLSDQSTHSKEFEGVIVATGFFSQPYLPDLPGVSTKSSTDIPSNNNVNHNIPSIIHSQEYTSHTDYANESVAVIGSSFSALEIAVDVSQSAKRVVSVLPRIPWVIPRYIPATTSSSKIATTSTTRCTTTTTNHEEIETILPVDLALYQRTKDAPQLPETTIQTPTTSQLRHAFLNKLIGPRQQQTSIGIPTNFNDPPMVAISDYYLDLVMDGTIDAIPGRWNGIDDNGSLLIDKSTQNKKESTHQQSNQKPNPQFLSNITKVIACTGYQTNLDTFLHESILHTINYDQKDTFAPMDLCWETLHPSLPNMAFCGMYRGPYMGVAELQARLAASVMSGSTSIDDLTYEQALGTSLEIRHQSLRPQFPHFDYIGFMDSIANVLANGDVDTDENDVLPVYNIQKGDMVTPAFYQPNSGIAQSSREELQQEVLKGKDGKYLPSIVLSALIGSWNFQRNIIHMSNNHKEYIHGGIQFTRPTLHHVLYREDGFYELMPGKTLNVFREYEYEVKNDDTLDIYFVEGGERAHLFLSLKFTKRDLEGYWIATSDHLCIKDLYKATFKVKMDGLACREIIMTYSVKGPAKDYESTTVLTPRLKYKH